MVRLREMVQPLNLIPVFPGQVGPASPSLCWRFLTQFFFKAPGMGRGGCVYEDAGDKHQIGRMQGIANTSSLHMIAGKKSALILIVQ